MEVLRVDQVETSLNTKNVIKRGFAIKLIIYLLDI